MPRPLRLSLVVLGLALAVYGTSTLTGGWLGTPPWWTGSLEAVVLPPDPHVHFYEIDIGRAPRPGREWISGAVIAVGVGFVAWGVRPRRHESQVTPG